MTPPGRSTAPSRPARATGGCSPTAPRSASGGGDPDARDRDLRQAAREGADALFLFQAAGRLRASGRPDLARDFLERAHDRPGDRLSLPVDAAAVASISPGSASLERAGALTSRIASVAPADSLEAIYIRALAALARRDLASNRSECARALASLGPGVSPEVVNAVAWICVIGPGATDDPDRVVPRAARRRPPAPGGGEAQRPQHPGGRPDPFGSGGRGHLTDPGGGRPARGGHPPPGSPLPRPGRRPLLPREDASRDLSPKESAGALGWDTIEIEILRREIRQSLLDRDFPSDPFTFAPPSPAACHGAGGS